MRDLKLKLGKKKERKRHGTWVNAYIKPTGREWKRRANRAVRRSKNVAGGKSYKKCWGFFEWS